MDVARFLADHADDDVCRFVTTGRRSGRPHDIEIWFGVLPPQHGGRRPRVPGDAGTRPGLVAPDGVTVVLICGNGPTADWYRNLVADPAVRVRIGDRWLTGVGRGVTDGPDRKAAGEVMGTKYGWWGGDPSIGLTIDDWTWTVPAVLIDQLAPE